MLDIKNRVIVVLGIAHQNGNEDWVILLGTAHSDQGEGNAALSSDPIEEVNANYILMDHFLLICSKHLHRGTQSDNAPSMTQSDQLSYSAIPEQHSKYHKNDTYNDMQQKIKRLQVQLGDQKGKSKDTPCVLDTLDPLFQKHENENVELKFQIRNYEKENAHLMAVYKNLFDSINSPILRKVLNNKDSLVLERVRYYVCTQSILGIPPSSSRPKLYAVTPLPKSTAIPKVGETNALSNQVTSNSVPSSQELKVMENDNVIAPGMFRIDPSNTSRENKFCLSTTLEQAFG
ncbi:hypothetical protein Tco_1018716 [Tanacetum coccineum]|uniref:Uncharacterized protein n=1 Tax=Tanacetum coccineum TaxID=301880 RepID=A0ABQ5FV30_9ASTR